MDEGLLNDPVWLERMYAQHAGAPEFPDFLQRWQRDSAQVRASQSGRLDLPYAGGAGEALDVFPGEAQRAPVLVFLHGGSWRSLDKADFSFLAPAFTQQGACVVLPNYALCPGSSQAPVAIPHIVRQMEKALVWVWQNIHALGGDPHNITLVGHGAGGHLAALLLASAWPLLAPGLPDGLVRKALSISGVYDLTPLRYTPSLQRDLRLTEQQVLRCSPALLSAPPQAHLHCIVGAQEAPEWHRQSRLMQQAWGSHFVPRCDSVPEQHHYSLVDALARRRSDVQQMAVNLLRL